MKTVPCDFLARECLRINLNRSSRYACFGECAFSSSQVISCLQHHVEVLYLSVVHMLNYAWKWILTWALGRGDYMCIGVFHNAQMVSSIPSVVIGYQPRSSYASVHMCWPAHWHFCLLADASVVYYFFLCIWAVASSNMTWIEDYNLLAILILFST